VHHGALLCFSGSWILRENAEFPAEDAENAEVFILFSPVSLRVLCDLCGEFDEVDTRTEA